MLQRNHGVLPRITSVCFNEAAAYPRITQPAHEIDGHVEILQRSHGVLPWITPVGKDAQPVDLIASTKPWRVTADNIAGALTREIVGDFLQRSHGVLPRVTAPIGNQCLRLREVSASAGRQALIGQLYAGLIAKIPAFLKSCILRALPGVIGTPAALANRRRPRLRHYQTLRPTGVYVFQGSLPWVRPDRPTIQ